MRRGRRFVLQLALLPILYLLSQVDGVVFTTVIATIVLITWPVTLAVAIILIAVAREENIPTLTEAADNAVSLALCQTALAFISGLTLLRLAGVVVTPVGTGVLVGLGYLAVILSFPTLTSGHTLFKVWLPMIKTRKAELAEPEPPV